MHFEGSCHCGAVAFGVEAPEPVPYNLCYCSICRKTAGAGGYAINLGARTETLSVTGRDSIGTYSATTGTERAFCTGCGSALWVWSEDWPELIHPHASAIDTDLPRPPERVHLMLGARANWAEPCLKDGDRTFELYPDESLADWHARHGLTA